MRGKSIPAGVTGQADNNITITIPVAVTSGLVHHTMDIGGTTRDRSCDFLHRYAEYRTVIFASASTHRGVEMPPEHIELCFFRF